MVLIGIMFAVSTEANEICDYAINELGASVDKTIPSYVPFKNEVLNAYTLDSTVIGHAKIEDGKITSIGCNETINPTIEVLIKDKGTLEDIKNAESKADTVNQKIKDKEIIIKGVTFTKKVKMFFVKIGLKISSWFA